MSDFFRIDEDPLLVLYRFFNVSYVTHPAGSPLPATYDVPVTRDARMPTHLIALFDLTHETEQGSSSQPILAPVDSQRFAEKFNIDIIPPSAPGSTLPVPHLLPDSGDLVVTIPVISLRVPHTQSVPLLLLYALNPLLRTGSMAWRLLPHDVVGEFPAFPAMTQMMLDKCSDHTLSEYVSFNQGLWQNILALGVRDQKVIRMVQTAWNITAEARRIRQRIPEIPPRAAQ